MSQKDYLINELGRFGFDWRNVEEIPDDLLDYLPENLDNENET